jgi:hypothetical protein
MIHARDTNPTGICRDRKERKAYVYGEHRREDALRATCRGRRTRPPILKIEVLTVRAVSAEVSRISRPLCSYACRLSTRGDGRSSVLIPGTDQAQSPPVAIWYRGALISRAGDICHRFSAQWSGGAKLSTIDVRFGLLPAVGRRTAKRPDLSIRFQ